MASNEIVKKVARAREAFTKKWMNTSEERRGEIIFDIRVRKEMINQHLSKKISLLERRQEELARLIRELRD